MVLMTALQFSCTKDPYKDIESNERSIEKITIGGDFIQIGPAIVDRVNAKAKVRILMQANTDLSKVPTTVQSSYRSSVNPAAGVINFKDNNNKYTYKVTSESGLTRDWEVEIEPFTETILGTYAIENLILYGGTGPEYGGGAVLALLDKPWNWDEQNGPSAEMDNELTFVYEGTTEDGKTYGKFTNSAGADGKYADFQYVADPKTDVNYHYRKLPKGEGTWERDYTANTVTFKFADGTTTVGSFEGAKKEDLGNGLSKTITNNSLAFTLNGTDDWGKIYTDYDKFVKRPRVLWIDIKRK